MQIIGGSAQNGAKKQQWGTLDGTVHDIWKTIDAGNGYYYLVSGVLEEHLFQMSLEKVMVMGQVWK